MCSKDCSTESFPVASSVLIVSLNPCTDYYSRVKGTFCGYWSSLIAAFFSPVLCPKNSLAALHLCTLNSVSTQGDHLTLQWPRNSPESKLEHSSHSSRWVPHPHPRLSTETAILHCLFSNVWTLVSQIFDQLLSCLRRRVVNVVPVTPSWPEVEVQCFNLRPLNLIRRYAHGNSADTCIGP